MAEIRVERKQRNILPWILGLLLLGLVIWAAAEAFESGREDALDGTAEVGVVRDDGRRLPLPMAGLLETGLPWLQQPEPVERTA